MKSASWTVIVVDDDDAVRDSLQTLLELQSCNIRAFETCQEFIDANPGEAVCLILDIHLPGMSGFELMEAMKQAGRKLPTILITARCDNSIRERAALLGAVALLEKPIEFSALMAAIERCAARGGLAGR